MNEKKEREFKNRVYGCVVIKAINSNYNADFTHQPRTLPDGIVYATDKALKWTVKNYLFKNYCDEKIFFWKRLNNEMNPLTIDETFNELFFDIKIDKKDETKKNKILIKLLECIDIRLFGATYADRKNEINISIHGPVQINHGVNRFPENQIYTEQIMSPFRNPTGKKSEDESLSDKAMTTLGSQSKLREGHYVHHFSINPLNLLPLYRLIENVKNEKNNLLSIPEKQQKISKLTEADIEKLKEAFQYGATYYDSASKAGTENELLLWVELNENENFVLPNFTELITVNRENEKVKIDLTKVFKLLESVKEKISNIEVYFNELITNVVGIDNNSNIIKKYELYKIKKNN